MEVASVIIWLASYPRSGNTLLRQILRQVFRQRTFSQYNDPADVGAIPELAHATGHVNYAGRWEDFYAAATDAGQAFLVKTHDAPPDDAPAIYMVRDGRAAAVSWVHAMQARQGMLRYSLDDIIEGRTRFGGWSAHLEAWQAVARPRTLFLRFEDVVQNPQPAIDRIGRLLGLPQREPFRNRRADLQKAAPGFVREGSTALNLQEMPLAQRARFRELHGEWLRRLGYTT